MYGVPLEEQPALAKITNISLGGITVQGEQALVRSLRLDRPESQRSSEFMVGFCLDGDMSFSCVCQAGFRGTLCEISTYGCFDMP